MRPKVMVSKVTFGLESWFLSQTSKKKLFWGRICYWRNKRVVVNIAKYIKICIQLQKTLDEVINQVSLVNGHTFQTWRSWCKTAWTLSPESWGFTLKTLMFELRSACFWHILLWQTDPDGRIFHCPMMKKGSTFSKIHLKYKNRSTS